MNRQSPWLGLWFVWAIPSAVVLLNLLWLFGARGVVLESSSRMARQRVELEAAVESLEGRLEVLEQAREDLESLQANLDSLRQEQLGGMRSRLVLFLIDLVRRAQDAGLSPQKVAYQVREQKGSELVHFTAVYGVHGRYEQVRQLISLLESSPQFIMVERLALKGDEDANSLNVNVNLTLATYFSDLDKELVAGLGIEELESEIESDAARAAPATSLQPPREQVATQRAGQVGRPPAPTGSQVESEETTQARQGALDVSGQPASPQVRRLSTRRQAGTVVRPEMTEPVDEFYTNVGVREVSGGN